MRVIRKDIGLREILPLERVPSSGAIGDWLRRSGATGGLIGLEKTNRKFLKRGLKYDSIKEYTLDIDATGIEAQKKSEKLMSEFGLLCLLTFLNKKFHPSFYSPQFAAGLASEA